MSTFRITATNLVTAVSQSYDQRERQAGQTLSEELAAISARLKEAMEGLGAWIQIHILLQASGRDTLESSARGLGHLDQIFRNARSELLSYSQQIPEPLDAPIAYEMLQVIERCFLEEIAKETSCEIAGFGFTSWGALMLYSKEVDWTPAIIAALFEQIPSPNWKAVRQILTQTQGKF
ncbi:MAG TPA: hypothetical protein VLE89_03955 [Chlamydiales bacterium]|nr:hypothetical protein [Chlamydiales bacterium]